MIEIKRSDENFECKKVLFDGKEMSFCDTASQQTNDDDEQRTIASELNEPIDDLVNSYAMINLEIY